MPLELSKKRKLKRKQDHMPLSKKRKLKRKQELSRKRKQEHKLEEEEEEEEDFIVIPYPLRRCLSNAVMDQQEDCEEHDTILSVRKDIDKEQVKDVDDDINTCVRLASIFRLPTKEELAEEATLPLLNLIPKLWKRITTTFRVLSVIEILDQERPTHKEYIHQLKMDLTSYSGYSTFMVEAVMEILGIMETRRFFSAFEKQPHKVLRANTLKTSREELIHDLSRSGINCEPIFEWSDVGFVVFHSDFILSRTREYLCGLYTIQRASSFLPVMALDPQTHEEIAEMWASHGDRTTYVASLMSNTGTIHANVVDKSSMSVLSRKLSRMEVKNTKVYNCDVTKSANFLGNKMVDRVLLHAPSSNTGIITNVVPKKTSKEDIQKCASLQKELLCAAIEMVDADSISGGYIVYSTSSIMVEENEAVIDYVLKIKDVTLVPTPFSIGRPGFTRYGDCHFDPSLQNTMRFYPHLNEIDGLFVAKLKKISNSEKREES